jgi:hypothetical protein
VIAVQYGGLTATTASLLVTFEQWTRDAAGAVVRGGAGADVRLTKEQGQWQVTEVFTATPLAAGPAGPRSSSRCCRTSGSGSPRGGRRHRGREPAAEADAGAVWRWRGTTTST